MAASNQISLKSEVYSDFRTDFAPHPVKGDLVLLKNEDAVTRAIRTLLLTNPYEKHWNPTYGAGLAAYLFEPISRITEQSIKTAIEYAIMNHEPRAQLHQVIVAALPDQNAYSASITFSVINLEQPITINQLLKRVR